MVILYKIKPNFLHSLALCAEKFTTHRVMLGKQINKHLKIQSCLNTELINSQ